MQACSVCTFVAVLAMAMTASSAIIVFGGGSCPSPGTLAGFAPNSYLGVWYEYERFPAVFEAGMDCVTATYGDNGDGTISVTNAGRRTILGRTQSRSIEGTATTPDAAKPAELSVSFGGVDMGSGPNYFVVDTDYTSYAVVFSCSGFGFFNIQFAWILTRAPGAEPASIDAIKSNLASAGIDVSRFNRINQSECP